MAEFTERQLAELNVTARHLGRALRSMERAGIPLPIFGSSSDHWNIDKASRHIIEASNTLIDGLEGLLSSTENNS